jgi:hypothetical protein
MYPANWIVATITGNQLNYNSAYSLAYVSWNPVPPGGSTQLIYGNTYADTYDSGYDSWHDVTMTSGWTAYGTRPLTYKFVENGEFVHMSGQIDYGTLSDGTTIGYVGPSYEPIHRPEVIPLGWAGSASLNGRAPYLEIEPNGNIGVYGVSSIGGSVGHLVVNGRYPLDAQ